MEINVAKFTGGVAGIVILGLFSLFFYLCYQLFFVGNEVEQVPSTAGINISILGPRMQKGAAILVNTSDKISLNKNKDLGFTESKLFKSFTDIPSDVPLSDSRGRADPFVLPYAAP